MRTWDIREKKRIQFSQEKAGRDKKKKRGGRWVGNREAMENASGRIWEGLEQWFTGYGESSLKQCTVYKVWGPTHHQLLALTFHHVDFTDTNPNMKRNTKWTGSVEDRCGGQMCNLLAHILLIHYMYPSDLRLKTPFALKKDINFGKE